MALNPLQAASLPSRGRFSVGDYELMAQLYMEGQSSREVARYFQCTARHVRRLLVRMGVTRSQAAAVALSNAQQKNRRVFFNQDFFEVLNEDSAWVLGLIYGDGHVMRDTRTGNYGVTLAGDKETLDRVASLLSLATLPRQVSPNGWTLTWYSYRMVQSLRQWGLVGGNKARELRWPGALPTVLQAPFLRGLWDSDGSWCRRGRSLRGRYTSASALFIEDLRLVLLGLDIACKVGTRITFLRGKLFPCSYLETGAADSRRLARVLYTHSRDLTRTPRKYAVVLEDVLC